MVKTSTSLFLILVACIIAAAIIQLFSTNDTQDFYKIIDTIVKVALGAWGGAKLSEKRRKEGLQNE